MNTVFEADGWMKFSEEDIFSDGCQPETATHNSGNERFTADLLSSLIDKLKAFTGCQEDENLLINSCEEIGRLDIQVMEDGEGTAATPQQIERWKAGKERLWLACYTFQIEAVEREPVDLKQIKAQFPTATDN